jgi:hypothetical protein
MDRDNDLTAEDQLLATLGSNLAAAEKKLNW